MAVIINDFEVVSDEGESQQRSASAESAQASVSAQPAPTPHDIERILEHQRERMERVWAH